MGWQCRARDGSGLVRGLIVDKGHSQAFTFATESAQRTPDDIPLVPCWNQHGHVGKIRPIPRVTRFESLARAPRSPWYENQGHPQQGSHSNQQFHFGRPSSQLSFGLASSGLLCSELRSPQRTKTAAKATTKKVMQNPNQTLRQKIGKSSMVVNMAKSKKSRPANVEIAILINTVRSSIVESPLELTNLSRFERLATRV